MTRKITWAITWGQVAVVAALGSARPGHAQDANARYPSMAPIEQYLMDRTAEIALARSAAPAAISGDARVLVLARTGYETAVEGKNGFVCIVERSWASPFDAPEFWNPKIRSPTCYNPPAARSILPAVVKRQQMISAGFSKARVIDGIKAAFDKGELSVPAAGSMAYMMSKAAYLNDSGNMAHVMFFEPLTDDKNWGAGVPGSPMFVRQDPMARLTTLIVPTVIWSDADAAPTALNR